MIEATPPVVAKAFVGALVGDPEWTTPSGIPAYTYFARLEPMHAFKEYRQVHQLREWDRMRDLIERIEVEEAKPA